MMIISLPISAAAPFNPHHNGFHTFSTPTKALAVRSYPVYQLHVCHLDTSATQPDQTGRSTIAQQFGHQICFSICRWWYSCITFLHTAEINSTVIYLFVISSNTNVKYCKSLFSFESFALTGKLNYNLQAIIYMRLNKMVANVSTRTNMVCHQQM